MYLSPERVEFLNKKLDELEELKKDNKKLVNGYWKYFRENEKLKKEIESLKKENLYLKKENKSLTLLLKDIISEFKLFDYFKNKNSFKQKKYNYNNVQNIEKYNNKKINDKKTQKNIENNISKTNKTNKKDEKNEKTKKVNKKMLLNLSEKIYERIKCKLDIKG